MSETIEQASELVDRAEINSDGVLVQYTKTEAALADLRKKYQGATFDLTTTKGDKEARAARLELVTLRGMLEKRRKELKKPALEFGQKIDAEAERITSEIKALETPIDAQIVADENRRAAEKAERERIEAARVSAHQTKLAAMRGCVARAQGLPSARIAKGIEQVEAIMLGVTAWEEFAADAATAKQETLTAMRVMFDAAKAREDEDARVEAQRIENERIAAENRAAAERLAEQQRALDAQAAALKAEQDAIDARRADEAAKLQREADEKRRAEEAEAKRATEEAIATAATPAPAQLGGTMTSYIPGPPPVFTESADFGVIAVDAAPAPVGQAVTLERVITSVAPAAASRAIFPTKVDDERPNMNLGEICTRLGFTVTADFLAELGFTATVERGARLYRSSDFTRICAAIVDHVDAVRLGVAA